LQPFVDINPEHLHLPYNTHIISKNCRTWFPAMEYAAGVVW
ncbi:629_t:CDS:2, partial [Rhizophagus irregularis]